MSKVACLVCDFVGFQWKECPECRRLERGAFASPPMTLMEALKARGVRLTRAEDLAAASATPLPAGASNLAPKPVEPSEVQIIESPDFRQIAADIEAERAEDSVSEDRPPAKFYAPKGECSYCDRRRQASKISMRKKARQA